MSKSGVYAHFGRMIMDILWLRGHTRDEVMSRLDVIGREHVEAAMARGKGAIFVTGHLGNWEVIGLAHGWTFGPLAVVARALDNPALDRRMCAFRAMAGNRVIYKRDALREVLRTLHAGQAVAILIDQNVQEKDGIFVDFFGRPAATTSALAALALRTGAVVVPVFALPLPGGRFRMVYEHPVEPPPSDDPDAIREFTQRCTDVLEMYVRRYPELWLWMHRRWRDVEPKGERVAGMFPTASGEEQRG